MEASMIELEGMAGEHINDVSSKAIALADEKQESVQFKFNETVVVVQPGETVEKVVSRWSREFEESRQRHINSQEYKDAEAKRKKDYADRCAAVMVEKAHSESEMRDAPNPWPYTMEQLVQYVNSLVEREHDYGTCVHAMELAATAAFNYISHKLGVTGFQASCADLSFLQRSRSIKGPFMIVLASDALYPQCDPREKFRKAFDEWQPWLKEEAQKLLKEKGEFVHPNVVKHWETLAGKEIPVRE